MGPSERPGWGGEASNHDGAGGRPTKRLSTRVIACPASLEVGQVDCLKALIHRRDRSRQYWLDKASEG